MSEAAMLRAKESGLHGRPFETSPNQHLSEVSIGRYPLKTGEKRANPSFGTNPAFNNSSLSVAPDSPEGVGRGGARNRADRPSHALKPAHIANLRAADSHAEHIGLPFTRMITIHWKAAGVPLGAMAKATGAFLDRMTKWLARRNLPTAWLWVHENAGEKCWHSHILIHIPAMAVKELPAAQLRWLRQITGQPYAKNVIRSDPIGGRLGLESTNPALHKHNRREALAYVLKGSIQETKNGCTNRLFKAQGLILGRRCSTSQNIGAMARAYGKQA